MADVKCDGSSFAKAIMVKAPTDHAGVDAQHDYIAKHFGKWRSIGVKAHELAVSALLGDAIRSEARRRIQLVDRVGVFINESCEMPLNVASEKRQRSPPRNCSHQALPLVGVAV